MAAEINDGCFHYDNSEATKNSSHNFGKKISNYESHVPDLLSKVRIVEKSQHLWSTRQV